MFPSNHSCVHYLLPLAYNTHNTQSDSPFTSEFRDYGSTGEPAVVMLGGVSWNMMTFGNQNV